MNLARLRSLIVTFIHSFTTDYCCVFKRSCQGLASKFHLPHAQRAWSSTLSGLAGTNLPYETGGSRHYVRELPQYLPASCSGITIPLLPSQSLTYRVGWGQELGLIPQLSSSAAQVNTNDLVSFTRGCISLHLDHILLQRVSLQLFLAMQNEPFNENRVLCLTS